MPQQSSSAKRHRQNERRRLRNKMIKSRVRTAIRKFADQVQSSSREEAEKGYIQCQALLDRAVSKGIFHRNLAARKKHRLYRLLQKQS